MNTNEIKQRYEAATDMVSDLCNGRKKWIMSVPAEADRDPDLVISHSLHDISDLLAEIDRLKAWVNDLQSGLYVNCVYCGHQYGPSETTPVTMADALKAHIEQCPEHPMSKLKAQNDQLVKLVHVQHEALINVRNQLHLATTELNPLTIIDFGTKTRNLSEK